MGWIRDGAYDHEGWVANVLADGRVSASTTRGGVIVHELTGDDVTAKREVRRYEGSNYLDVVPWDQVVTWRVTCECGWTGSEHAAVTDPKHGDRYCPEESEERVFAPEWYAHVAPFAALTDLEQLVDQLRDVETKIEDTVRLGRAGGASWAQVGRAAESASRAPSNDGAILHPITSAPR